MSASVSKKRATKEPKEQVKGAKPPSRAKSSAPLKMTLSESYVASDETPPQVAVFVRGEAPRMFASFTEASNYMMNHPAADYVAVSGYSLQAVRFIS